MMYPMQKRLPPRSTDHWMTSVHITARSPPSQV